MKNIIKRLLGGLLISIAMLIMGLFIFVLTNDTYMFGEFQLAILSVIFVVSLGFGIFLVVSTIEDKKIKKRIIRTGIIIVFLIYLAILFSITLGNSMYSRVSNDISFFKSIEFSISQSNFIPFKTIFGYITMFINNTINKKIIIINLIGNLVVFMPIGLLLPVIFKRLDNFKKMILCVFLVTAFIEVCQLFIGSGVFDIDDLILNLCGGMIAYCIYSKTFIKNIAYKYC